MTKKYGVEIAILSVQIQTSALIWFAGRQLLKKKTFTLKFGTKLI